MNNFERLKNVLSEGLTNQQRKVFVDYGKEIVTKLKKAHPELEKDEKALRMALRKTMMNMALPKDNPNYKNYEKYMPAKFDKNLFDNGDKNSYDSLWMSQTDAAHDTIFRQAMK